MPAGEASPDSSHAPAPQSLQGCPHSRASPGRQPSDAQLPRPKTWHSGAVFSVRHGHRSQRPVFSKFLIQTLKLNVTRSRLRSSGPSGRLEATSELFAPHANSFVIGTVVINKNFARCSFTKTDTLKYTGPGYPIPSTTPALLYTGVARATSAKIRHHYKVQSTE